MAIRSRCAARSRKRRSTSTKLNPLTPAAFVAIEDRRFYRHWGIDPRGIGRALLADLRGGGVRAGRQHDHPAARQDQLPVGRPHHQAQGAGGDHRLLARGLADQAGDPLALPVERLFRRRRLWPARRRASLFRPRSGAPQPRPVGDACRAWCRRRRGSRRPSTSPPRRSAAGWCFEAMADTGAISARGRDRPPGAAGRAGSQAARRDLFCRLGRAVGARRRSSPTSARSGSRRRSTATSSGWPCALSAAPLSATRKRRWSRCGPTDASSPWSAARITPTRRSTASPRRGGSPARRSNCSSISPRCAPAGRPTA